MSIGAGIVLLWVTCQYLAEQGHPVNIYASNYRWGEKLFKERDYQSARPVLETTLEQVSEVAPNSEDHAEVLATLCALYIELEEYKNAKQSCQAALKISDELYGRGSFKNKQLKYTLSVINLRESTPKSEHP